MKKIIRVILPLLVLAISQQSCNGQGVDSIIKKYDDTDFSSLKGFSVYFRSAGHENNTSIYFVNSYGGGCSPYIVELNDRDKIIVNINNDLVLKSCSKDYMSREKITQVLVGYAQYDLCLVQVDNEGNVYINPDRPDRATLLRKSKSSTPKDLALFEHYKGNWYVKK
ncbi:hypothetical protein [Pedobacter hiemivivus]|uniref:Uncharacterized protein n=1 Tax=Pedobacter hiemivivus TaxID=2530454 RepID=A0A4R0NHF6_9SPHI|nr:hypothetical protein [Pedobacter hiemivivus]TCC99187.1 hypothetical protein EZ444_00455 [Pedobacter hiemivivus]